MPDLSLTLLRHRMAASRQLARRAQPSMAVPPRPKGRLLWVHMGSGTRVQPIQLILSRLLDELTDLSILTTGIDGAAGDGTARRLTAPAPVDTEQDAQDFLNFWRPSTCLFCGAEPFPILWDAALARGIPLLAAEVDPARHAMPLIQPMRRFDAVLSRAPDPRLGPVIELPGPLATVASPPSIGGEALAISAQRIGARPVWLAYRVPADELDLVLHAHRRAAQMTHRLLLILLANQTGQAREGLESSGLRWQNASADPIAPDTQVILADADPGLWLRLSPVAYLGGSLGNTGPVATADVAAGLGAAILTGPKRADAPSTIDRLLDADGARRIADAESLGAQVETLLNPEEAAALAHNAWTVTTEGAEASARLFELLDDTLAGVPE